MATTLSPAAIPSADGRRRGEGVIVVQTLADRIFGIVRERIVAGTLPGDRPIRQDALAAELGVSISTVESDLRMAAHALAALKDQIG